MLIEWFLSIKSLPNLLFGVLCLPGGQSHPFAQPTINPLACCICWAGLLGRTVFPPWNEGPNFGSYICNFKDFLQLETNPVTQLQMKGANRKSKTIRIILIKIVFHHGELVNVSQSEAIEASGVSMAPIILFMCLVK